MSLLITLLQEIRQKFPASRVIRLIKAQVSWNLIKSNRDCNYVATGESFSFIFDISGIKAALVAIQPH